MSPSSPARVEFRCEDSVLPALDPGDSAEVPARDYSSGGETEARSLTAMRSTELHSDLSLYSAASFCIPVTLQKYWWFKLFLFELISDEKTYYAFKAVYSGPVF